MTEKKSARPNSETAEREAIVAAAKAMSRENLSPGRSGNVSARVDEHILITPSALPYEEMMPADIVTLDREGNAVSPTAVPSSEWRFHVAALNARPDRAAVVHTHSRCATALACCREPIPAFHYMVALAGADTIPLVSYKLFGSQALADGVASALIECDACLLANHGVVALGSTPAAALDLAREVEQLAEMYLLARSAGSPVILSAEEMSEVHARFATYGRRPTDHSAND